MPLELTELFNNTIEYFISPNNIILSNRFILAITISLVIILIFYLYSKDDIDTIYEDSNIYELTIKSSVVSTFVVYVLLYFNNKIIEDNLRNKYKNHDAKDTLDIIVNQKTETGNETKQ